MHRRLDADARRGQLVQVGVDLLRSTPFDQITPDAVARIAGVSKGLVFHYFPTKRDLQVAVLRAATAELLARLDPDPEMPVPERLREGLDAFVALIEQQPANYRAVSRSAGSDPRLLAVFEDTRAAVVGIIAGALGVAEPPAGLRIAIRGWIAMVEESVLVWLEGTPVPRERLVDFLQKAALTMLADAMALGGAAETAAPSSVEASDSRP
ncbi:MAG TPA: TetR/AcrR family transcriptional regulator [Acidimicrobiia bacterium]|nr:TetR/AcrR family transcriptional regulator [Acidimicrobiia bacterium]